MTCPRAWRLVALAFGALGGCATPGGPAAKMPPLPANALPPVDASSPAAQKRDEWRRSRARIYMDDFG